MSKRLMKTRLFAPWAVCCGAVLATALSATMPLAAASKASKVGKAAAAANQPPARDADQDDTDDSSSESSGEHIHIRLNYLRASWRKVLEDVAKALDKELVADELPAKTYSRLDRKQHSPDEALRILNRDLAAFGQKLVVKGDHLVLISVRQSRMDYSPAVIRGEAERAAEARYLAEQAEDEAAQARGPRSPRRNAPADAEQVWPRQPAGRDVVADDSDETPRRLPARSARNVRQAGAEEEQPETARPAPRRAPREEAPAGDLIETEIRLKARDAGSIEKLLQRAFRGNTRRLERGPGGLEGFAVLTGADEGDGARPKTRFRIGVDVERNTLVVEATERETRAVETLVKAFDKLPPGENGAIRAVPSKKATNPLARSLQGELDRLALATRLQAQADEGADEERPAPPPARNPRGAAPRDQAAEAAADQPAGKTPRAGAGTGTGMPLPQALQGSLKGEVSIEAVPELNLFILKGNEQDVETVMGILKEIEKMSEASAPQVRMAVVEHLNSEALATLLTSVYDRISPTRQTRGATGTANSSVAIFPVARPNALLIVAPQGDLDAILELLEELDQPSDPQTEYKVFRLKHAVPSQVVDTIREMYPSDRPTPGQPGGANANNQNSTAVLTPRVVVVPDSRTNSFIIQARARDLAEVAALIKDLDSPESSVVNQLKIYPLENATADELAATLQQALLSILTPARASATQGAGQGGFGGAGGGGANQQIQNEDLRDVKSSILEFLDANGGVERAIRSGIISDIRISPDARTNSIVVTAPPESIPMIESLIERLDQPSAAVAEIKVFPLQNADASGMVLLLEGLFSGQSQQQRGGALGAARQALGLQLAGTDDASSTLIPLRFEVDSRTNRIIAIGGAEALNVVHAVLLSLDSSDVRQRQNRVYSLRNTPAADVALAIQQFLTSRRQIEQQDPALVSAFDQFDREVVVVPEAVGNKLLISATPRYFDDIIQIIQDLDQVPKQVIIQALLVEVELSSNDEWGVELGLQDSILFDRSAVTELVQIPITNTSPNGVQTTTQTIISQSATPGYLFNNQQLGNNTSPNLNTSRLGTQGLSNFAVGRVNGDLGYGGLVLAAGSESVSVLLRALAARRRIDVLSRPQIQALDNQLATIQVGQEVPRVDSFTINQNTGNATPI
ncbi:MAG: secretin N-terminal domain-containing protein, partial [Planctomycetaceae bacterium]